MIFLYKIFISFFYLGYIKIAPGSIVSFIILCIYYFVPNDFILQLYIVISVSVIGFALCFYHSTISEEKDPSFIVIDEVLGMLISLFMIPKSFLLYVASFILFRYFDIIKPSFIDKSQNVGNGIGIMLDDVISGFITVLILWGFILCQ
mgnify:CR=1 FL=1